MSNKHEKYLTLGKTYLQSNAYGMWDGGLKASTHAKLVDLFISERLNITIKKSRGLFIGDESIGSLVRKATLDLTDNLDIEIGFPTETAPNYKKLTPLFVEKFVTMASEWFDDNPGIVGDEELTALITGIAKRKFTYSFHALDSYGFEFVDGNPEGSDRFLTMRSKLGQTVTIRPNEYFGCKFIIDKSLKQEDLEPGDKSDVS